MNYWMTLRLQWKQLAEIVETRNWVSWKLRVYLGRCEEVIAGGEVKRGKVAKDLLKRKRTRCA